MVHAYYWRLFCAIKAPCSASCCGRVEISSINGGAFGISLHAFAISFVNSTLHIVCIQRYAVFFFCSMCPLPRCCGCCCLVPWGTLCTRVPSHLGVLVTLCALGGGGGHTLTFAIFMALTAEKRKKTVAMNNGSIFLHPPTPKFEF